MKVRWSCFYQKGWQPSPDVLAELGLTPADGPALAGAVERSYFRVWTVLEPLCASIVGNPELAHRLGVRVCSSSINESAVEAAERDRKMVGEVRAGLRSEPKQGDLDPYAKQMLTLSAEMKNFERDLAASLGPETARRVAYDKSLGMCSGTAGGK